MKGKSPGNYLLFGMITKVKEKLHLEDVDALIELSWSPTLKQGDGIFTENCFVLVEGDLTSEGVPIITNLIRFSMLKYCLCHY